MKSKISKRRTFANDFVVQESQGIFADFSFIPMKKEKKKSLT